MRVMDLSSEELVPRLILDNVNYDIKGNELDGLTYVKKGDVALTVSLYLGDVTQNRKFGDCIPVTQEMAEKWGIPKEQLFEIAASNAQKYFPVHCYPLSVYLKTNDIESASPRPFLDVPGGINQEDISVITNSQYFCGPAPLIYDNSLLGKIATEQGCDRLILIPSGHDHIFCVAERNKEDVKECTEIFLKLMQNTEAEQRISNSILLYDCAENKIFEIEINQEQEYVEKVSRIQGRGARK